MRILVTGADGFVGTHLCRELHDYGHGVVRTDRDEADLAQSGEARYLVTHKKPDYVVHLAARYGRLLCRDEPHLAVQDNTASTTELAAVCAELGIPVLYASSSEVYGDHGTEWITEQSELRMPTTIYGLSKRWGEEVLDLYLPSQQLCIVRMNMLYGPEQLGGYGRCALATFIKNAVEGEPNIVHGGTSRSWLYISDAVWALTQLIEKERDGIWNLGNQHDFRSMVDVARMVGGEYIEVEPPSDQIHHKNFDSTKLETALDWRPEVDLEEGIARTVEWARREQVASLTS